MELKQLKERWENLVEDDAFNRTTMELKPSCDFDSAALIESF